MSFNYSTWYIRYKKGKGTYRIFVKETNNAVFGGAGSVSQMVDPKHVAHVEYIKIKIAGTTKNIECIQFTQEFAMTKPHIMKIGQTLQDYIDSESGTKAVGDYFG